MLGLLGTRRRALRGAASIAGLVVAAGMTLAPTGARATTSSALAPVAQPHVMPVFQPPPVGLPAVCLDTTTYPPNCVGVAPPPSGQPAPGNMSYFGGHVQLKPQLYLVFWGWDQVGAFPGGSTTPPPAGATLPTNDPDGAGARMESFLKAIGGSAWAKVQDQYYQGAGASQSFINEDSSMWAGVWVDDANANPGHLTARQLAEEATRAAGHFNVSGAALDNADFIIAQPPGLEDAGFNTGGLTGYCAYHDYTTQPPYIGDATHPGDPNIQRDISFTNMPYVLQLGGSCGQSSVNAGAAGNLDGYTIVLGHEVQETITDPGAGVVLNPVPPTTSPVGLSPIMGVGGTDLGGWLDYAGYENGDKCAWVGDFSGLTVSGFPGGLGNITGSDSVKYPVQALWSNAAAHGVGYCDGTAPLPL